MTINLLLYGERMLFLFTYFLLLNKMVKELTTTVPNFIITQFNLTINNVGEKEIGWSLLLDQNDEQN